ncbi:MAG: hypothetical protein ACR2PM_20510 [Hyphomicrobiales bacterium]
MRNLVILFVLMLCTAWPGTAYSGELFRSDELKFEIEFPAKPERQSRSQTFASGDAQIVRFKSIGKRLRPSISVTVFSRGAFTREEAATGLELSGRRQADRLNGTIVSSKALNVNGIAGRETVIEGAYQGRAFFYRAQTFYAGNRQYLLSVLAQKLEDVSAPADDYFASFKLWE